MKWFYNLKRSTRIIIAVVSWLPLVVFASLISGAVGENGENMQAWQAVLTVVFLAVGIVFLVLAIKARKREKTAEKAVNTTPPPDFSTRVDTPVKTPIVAPSDTVSQQTTTPKKRAELPKYNNNVKITVFENRIKDIKINIGDDVLIKFEKDAIMRSSNGNAIIDANCYIGDVKIGLFPYAKSLRLINGLSDYPCKIASVDNKDDKTIIFVNVDLPFMVDAKLPLVVNLVGTSFENRNEIIKNSNVGDCLRLVHEPTTEYPNVIKVYNTCADGCIGVIPKEIDEKLIKKYKSGCELLGVITSIYGGSNNKNYGVDIMITAHK